MNTGLKRALLYGGLFLVLLAAIVVALPFFIPVESYRGQIEQAANRATGRTLHIAGPLQLTIFPQVGLSVRDVRFANKPGGMAVDMASAGNVQISVALLPLLSGNIQLAQIILDKPSINLEVDKQGQTNWTFGTGAASTTGSTSLPSGLHFSGIKITQGRISYSNLLTGKTHVLENVDLDIDVTDQNKPVTVHGSLVNAGHNVTLDGTVATPDTLSRGATTALNLSLSGDLLKADFKGQIAPDRALSGILNLNTSSVRQLGAWLGADMPAGGGLKAMSLTSNIASKDGLDTLSDMRLSLDGMNITGNLSADTNPKIPAVKGEVSIDHLDLNPYMKGAAQSDTKTSGWSNDPLALDALGKFNADLTLSAGSLTIRNLHIGKSSVVAHLSGGVLRADLNPVTLYGGVGHAVLTVDVNSTLPQFHNTLEFDNVAVSSLLGDAIGVNKIEGTGTLVLDISAAGKSANAVMHSLSGTGRIAVGNGKIRGVDLGMVARTIQTVLSGNATSTGAATDFTQINGSFVIAKGVLTNKDFKLAGPGLNATGEGTLDIGAQAMDFKITPTANLGVASIGIPFRISGPWSGLHYRPDLEGLAKGVVQDLVNDPKKAGNLLNNILGNRKSGQSGNGILGGLFGH